MPSMPEMFAFCGKRFPVYKSAYKTCDTVFRIRGRGVRGGSSRDGVAMAVPTGLSSRVPDLLEGRVVKSGGGASSCKSCAAREIHGRWRAAAECRESDVWAHAQVSDPQDRASTYVCHATQLPSATEDLSWWDTRQYIEDYVSGNVGLK